VLCVGIVSKTLMSLIFIVSTLLIKAAFCLGTEEGEVMAETTSAVETELVEPSTAVADDAQSDVIDEFDEDEDAHENVDTDLNYDADTESTTRCRRPRRILPVIFSLVDSNIIAHIKTPKWKNLFREIKAIDLDSINMFSLAEMGRYISTSEAYMGFPDLMKKVSPLVALSLLKRKHPNKAEVFAAYRLLKNSPEMSLKDSMNVVNGILAGIAA
jgi:hypothetical protein